jgi:hypothetical protein
MYVWQIVEPNVDFKLLSGASGKDLEEQHRKYSKLIKEQIFNQSQIKNRLEWLFSYVPEGFSQKWQEKILDNCDLGICFSLSFHTFYQEVEFNFIFKTEDSVALSYIKSNWHIAWAELFPTQHVVYGEEQIKKATEYAEANAKLKSNSQGNVSIEDLNYAPILPKDLLIDEYLQKHCTGKSSPNLCRSRFTFNAQVLWGSRESILFNENLKQDENSQPVEENDQGWIDIFKEYHQKFKYPYYSVESRGGKLKLKKISPVTDNKWWKM